MKVRIEDTPERVEALAAALRAAFNVRHESGDYRNRPPSPLVRRYMDVRLHAPRETDRVPGFDPAAQEAAEQVTAYLDALTEARASDTIDAVAGGPRGRQRPGVYRRKLTQRDLRAVLAENQRLTLLLQELDADHSPEPDAPATAENGA